MANYQSGGSPTLSMREKTLHKRRITKEHNSNFHAGYVHINEEYLHKTGIRGRKRYFVYALLILMGLIAVVNIFITWTIMGSLRISKDGMGTLEFIPSSRLLRFLGDSDMGDVTLIEDTVFSLVDREIEITAMKDQSVNLVSTKSNTTLSVDAGSVSFDKADEFVVVDPESGRTVFTTDFSQLRFPDDTQSVDTDEITTSRLVSPKQESLNLESGKQTILRGVEGIDVTGKEVVITAEGDINIKPTEKLTLDAKETLYMDSVKQMPVSTGENIGNNDKAESYRLCVCMPSGKVFAVPAPFHCDQANESKNPCQH